MAAIRQSPIPGARWPREGTARAWLASRADGARLHAGVDLGRNEPVLAPEAGRVVLVAEASYGGQTPRFSRPAGWGGYGPRAVLIHGESGFFHLLAHVDDVRVSEGDEVAIGQQVATVSPVGRHLHWEVRRRARPPAGVAVVEIVDDPAAWLRHEERPWTPELGMPERPGDTWRTPRAARPSWEDEVPAPFPVGPGPKLRQPSGA